MEKKVKETTTPTTKFQKASKRSEILDEIWAAEKHTIDGKWYVKLSDVCDILGSR